MGHCNLIDQQKINGQVVCLAGRGISAGPFRARNAGVARARLRPLSVYGAIDDCSGPRHRGSVLPETSALILERAPIIEAVVDFHCDLPPALHRGHFHAAAQKVFADVYPEFRTSIVHEQQLAVQPGKQPKSSTRQLVRGYQSLARDKKQLVQSRFDGFSFHRLTPYSTLDDYLPEIQRCWDIYVQFAQVVVVKKIALRYINRLELPLTDGAVNVGEFLNNGPVLPRVNQADMRLTGFMHQHQMLDMASKNEANVILAAQPAQPTVLPIILDVDVSRAVRLPPSNWTEFLPVVASLRSLKNDIFRHTLTPQCLRSYQQPSP